MEKQKRWQLALIVTVIVLTLYNILPTIFYYSHPLRDPVGEDLAKDVAVEAVTRANSLEVEAQDWLSAYCKHLGLHPASIELDRREPRYIRVTFNSKQDADLLKRFLPRAGSMIPFAPAQLDLSLRQAETETHAVLVERKLGIHIDPSQVDQFFSFASKWQEDGRPTDLYAKLVLDRVSQVGLALAGRSPNALQLEAALKAGADMEAQAGELLLDFSRQLVEYSDTFGVEHPLTQRFFASFGRSGSDNSLLVDQWLAKLEAVKGRLAKQKTLIEKEQEFLKEADEFLDSEKGQLLASLEKQEELLSKATQAVRVQKEIYKRAPTPLSQDEVLSTLNTQLKEGGDTVLALGSRHPFVQALVIDWDADRLHFQLHPDVMELRTSQSQKEWDQYRKGRISQLIFNEIARVARVTDETINPRLDEFALSFSSLTDSESFLALDLGELANVEAQQLLAWLQDQWKPSAADLKAEVFPISDFAQFQQRAGSEKRLGLVVYAPSADGGKLPKGFRANSIYVIGRGLQAIVEKAKSLEGAEAQDLLGDLTELRQLLQDQGFFAYSASAYGMDKEYHNDIIFELNDFYSPYLNATREEFQVHGSKRFAVLEFSDVEQRILTTNRIEENVHEDLLKWRDEYEGAQVSLRPADKYLVPAPSKNALVENFKINWRKYFRGDDRKILRWGLDLSGGKSVRIGLRDQNNQVVSNPEDLKQAVNELYTRINAMGVAERSIRIENNNILLDFPGVQGLSADELIRASAMYFHVVNEKFSPRHASLKDSVNAFLEGVWNEARVTNRRDVESINQIAREHLGQSLDEGQGGQPRSEAARELVEAGLVLADPQEDGISNAFDEKLSSIAMFRGEDASDWYGQSHPLVITFANYALEGSSLEQVQASYDPSKGNILTFGVRASYTKEQQLGSPRDDFYAWTSQFSQKSIEGTIRETYSRGDGWRMAVILNGQVVSAPTLSEALRDRSMIHGSFSQREVNRLVADLKAGSLSFTPKILSETNVSPDLGQEERFWGITAAMVGLLLVCVAMISYYRFAGVIASIAVVLNLLIMWGVLQNLDAALTLPGIAGIILTVGMAVDANVLVFERIREEFRISRRIGSAIHAGYRKAFSAILDSNVTTIIAALILIQFDSGPIRGFATTLIIGICSSMFTALFMTRYFFAGWVQNPENKELRMSEFFTSTNFDFLGHWKTVAMGSCAIMIVGGGLLVSQWQGMLGMDFTGGYAVNLTLVEKDGTDYRQSALEAFDEAGALAGDVEVRELNRPNQLRVQMGFSMEDDGHPFANLPERAEVPEGQPEYLSNPRLAWVVKTLEDRGLTIKEEQLVHLDKNWTLMSGQFSEVMRNNAIMALGCALLSILVYLTFRFEFKYAISAIIALTHDVAVTLGMLGILYKLGAPVQIDLEVIGAIMTIIGYSLNDTIIIFDRIREDLRVMKKHSFTEVVNHALNVTLSRTLITSGTTLLVLIALVGLGGSAIFDLALVMTIGVAFGTLSSLFIASPVMLYFHRRELANENNPHHLKPKKA